MRRVDDSAKISPGILLRSTKNTRDRDSCSTRYIVLWRLPRKLILQRTTTADVAPMTDVVLGSWVHVRHASILQNVLTSKMIVVPT
jgi:hypothetical protein